MDNTKTFTTSDGIKITSTKTDPAYIAGLIDGEKNNNVIVKSKQFVTIPGVHAALLKAGYDADCVFSIKSPDDTQSFLNSLEWIETSLDRESIRLKAIKSL